MPMSAVSPSVRALGFNCLRPVFCPNSVCHGERLEIDAAGYAKIEEEVLDLIEKLKRIVLSHAENKSFALQKPEGKVGYEKTEKSPKNG